MVGLGQAAQQVGAVDQRFGDDVDHQALFLHLAAHRHELGAEHDPAKALEHRRPHHQIGDPALVLDGDEDDAARGARPLADQDQAGDLDPAAVVDRGQALGLDHPPIEPGAQQGERMAAQRQAQIGIILGDLLAERHPRQGDARLGGRRPSLGPGEQGRQVELVAGAIQADGAPDGAAPVEASEPKASARARRSSAAALTPARRRRSARSR